MAPSGPSSRRATTARLRLLAVPRARRRRGSLRIAVRRRWRRWGRGAWYGPPSRALSRSVAVGARTPQPGRLACAEAAHDTPAPRCRGPVASPGVHPSSRREATPATPARPAAPCCGRSGPPRRATHGPIVAPHSSVAPGTALLTARSPSHPPPPSQGDAQRASATHRPCARPAPGRCRAARRRDRRRHGGGGRRSDFGARTVRAPGRLTDAGRAATEQDEPPRHAAQRARPIRA